MYGDMDLDCRLLFIGDHYRLLLRAYAEAIFRLSRDRSLAERDAFLRRSAEVAQFYDITTTGDRIALRMKDEVFAQQAPLDELDLRLVVGRGADEVTVPLPLSELKAAGTLLPLLNGDCDRTAIDGRLAGLGEASATWARELLDRWIAAGLVEPSGVRPNPFADATPRPRVTFMGHTSIMVQTETTTVITDPLYRPTLGIPDSVFDVAATATQRHLLHAQPLGPLRSRQRCSASTSARPVVIPRVNRPTAFNPPMVPALQLLGFTDIREIDVWETTTIGDIEMVAVPFHGEQDEPDAEIDHYTYVFKTKGLAIYGGVDAYRDTYGEMLPALERVRREWAPDVAFLPISRMTYA